MNIKFLSLLLLFVGSYIGNLNAQENVTTARVYCALSKNFDPIKHTLQGTDSVVFAYNKNGTKISAIEYTGENSLYPSLKTNYLYNSSNQPTLEHYFQWDSTINNWNKTPFKQAVFTYNGTDSLQTITYVKMVGNSWQKTAKWEFNYDENKQKTAEIEFTWDQAENNWSNVGCQKFTMQYKNNQRTSKINHTWDYKNNQFKMVSKTTYTYTNDNLLETTTNLVLNNNANWEQSTKDSIIYNNGKIKKTQIGFYFDNIKIKKWETIYKFMHIINLDNQIVLTLQIVGNLNNTNANNDIYKIDYKYTKDHQLASIITNKYDSITQDFKEDNKTALYYTFDKNTPSKSELDKVFDVKIHPNPFTDKIQIKSNCKLDKATKIYLFNNLGETLELDKEYSNDDILISTTTLNKGIYYINIENNEDIYLTKIFKL